MTGQSDSPLQYYIALQGYLSAFVMPGPLHGNVQLQQHIRMILNHALECHSFSL